MKRSEILKKVSKLPWRVFALGFAIGLLLTGLSYSNMDNSAQGVKQPVLASHHDLILPAENSHHQPDFNFYQELSEKTSLPQSNKQALKLTLANKTGVFYLDTGLFKEHEKILAYQNKLKSWSVATQVLLVETIDQQGYYLKIGPFSKINQAFDIKRRLSIDHINTTLVSHAQSES